MGADNERENGGNKRSYMTVWPPIFRANGREGGTDARSPASVPELLGRRGRREGEKQKAGNALEVRRYVCRTATAGAENQEAQLKRRLERMKRTKLSARTRIDFYRGPETSILASKGEARSPRLTEGSPGERGRKDRREAEEKSWGDLSQRGPRATNSKRKSP